MSIYQDSKASGTLRERFTTLPCGFSEGLREAASRLRYAPCTVGRSPSRRVAAEASTE
ncbi:MAG: hypothetical protein NHB32_06350 [Fischerella sp. CENA71]|nr:hypothetical protein [Fischerella sp. CENA71]